MTKTILLVFALALASQVLCAPQDLPVVDAAKLNAKPAEPALPVVEVAAAEAKAPSVNVNVNVHVNYNMKETAGVDAKQTPEEDKEDAAEGGPSLFQVGPTTAKPLPDRIRESVQTAISQAGQAVRVIPATITSALQNFANGVRQALRPRTPTTPAPAATL